MVPLCLERRAIRAFQDCTVDYFADQDSPPLVIFMVPFKARLSLPAHRKRPSAPKPIAAPIQRPGKEIRILC
jgi:hypothetical protein